MINRANAWRFSCIQTISACRTPALVGRPRSLVNQPRSLVNWPRSLLNWPRSLVNQSCSLVDRPRSLVIPSPLSKLQSRCFCTIHHRSSSHETVSLAPMLVAAIEAKAEKSVSQLKELRKYAGDVVVHAMTVQTTLSGMRGAQLLLCDTSEVDPIRGISYRGIPLPELMTRLPSTVDESGYKWSPPSEAVLWLLLTGVMPTSEEVECLRRELLNRSKVPSACLQAVSGLPPQTHPMTQLIVGIAAAQHESVFSRAYQDGSMRKAEYWKYSLEDGLRLIGMLPGLASLIFNRLYMENNLKQEQSKNLRGYNSLPIHMDPQLDWAANFARMLGLSSPRAQDTIRLYMVLHADHEGGNVSAHAAHLVGSALSDPYLAFTASMCGLAGPLHGLANQGCLRFLKKMQKAFIERKQEISTLTDDIVRNFIQTEVLGKGDVVPGFGHAVLRATDPRFTIQENYSAEFASDSDDELLRLLRICVRVVPELLRSTGKVSNPYPNVDAHSGVLLNHVGLTQESFYTVLFGVSRALGVVSQLVWDRLFNLPIERPKSVTLARLLDVAHSTSSTGCEKSTPVH